MSTLDRKQRLPLPWVPLALAAYAGFYLAISYLILQSGRHFTFCLLKILTGLPCPFCGGTRAAFALLGGDLLRAFWLNPLAVSLILFFLPGYLVYNRVLRPRGWEKKLSRLFWLLSFLALAANWAYLIIVKR